MLVEVEIALFAGRSAARPEYERGGLPRLPLRGDDRTVCMTGSVLAGFGGKWEKARGSALPPPRASRKATAASFLRPKRLP